MLIKITVFRAVRKLLPAMLGTDKTSSLKDKFSLRMRHLKFFRKYTTILSYLNQSTASITVTTRAWLVTLLYSPGHETKKFSSCSLRTTLTCDYVTATRSIFQVLQSWYYVCYTFGDKCIGHDSLTTLQDNISGCLFRAYVNNSKATQGHL